MSTIGGLGGQTPIGGQPTERAKTTGVPSHPIQADQKAVIGEEFVVPHGGGAEFQKFAGMEPEHAVHVLSTLATAPDGVPTELASAIHSALKK